VRNVTLTIARTQVNYVAPYVSRTNTPADVIIRGEGFNKIAVTGVRFGGTPATSFAIDSDTQIRARHPALAKGSYNVQLANAGGAVRSSAQLVVADPPAYTATTLSYPDGPTHVVSDACYDEERRSLYVVSRPTFENTGPQEIRRFTFDGTDWSTAVAPAPAMTYCAL